MTFSVKQFLPALEERVFVLCWWRISSEFGWLVSFLDLLGGWFLAVLGFFCFCLVLWKGYCFARLGLLYDMLIPLLVDHFIVMIRSSASYRASALVRDGPPAIDRRTSYGTCVIIYGLGLRKSSMT